MGRITVYAYNALQVLEALRQAGEAVNWGGAILAGEGLSGADWSSE